MNNKYGAGVALEHEQLHIALVTCLTSRRIATRKLTSELPTFLCHWNDRQGHSKVLCAMDHVMREQQENGRFDSWMRGVEMSIGYRGNMSSHPSVSNPEFLLKECLVSTPFLINMMVDAPEEDLQLRCHIRVQLASCGIKRILFKMEAFNYDVIDKEELLGEETDGGHS
jgi:cytokinesis protein